MTTRHLYHEWYRSEVNTNFYRSVWLIADRFCSQSFKGKNFDQSSKWAEYSRQRNYIPFDYGYNLLQSCEKDAILFTYGDNDTFPLWCLQDVYGIRRDIRVAQLSLSGTGWYIDQLKNHEPYFQECHTGRAARADYITGARATGHHLWIKRCQAQSYPFFYQRRGK